MADDLPPGYKLDSPPQAAGSDLPPGFKLDEAPVSREQEIRRENLKKLMATSAGQQTLSGLVTGDASVCGFSGYSNRLKDAMTSGLARPIGAAMTTAGGEIGEYFGGKPATLGERWRGGIGAEEDYAKAMEEKSKGVVGTGVSVLGSLASAGRGAGAPSRYREKCCARVRRAQSRAGPGTPKASATQLTGSATGGVVGAGTTGIVGAGLDRLKRVAGAVRDVGEASRGGTSLTEATKAGAIFDKLDNAGVHFSGTETPALANSVNAATSGPLPASVRGEIAEIVQDVNQRVANGAMTFGDVRAVQSEISKLKANTNPDVRRVAGDMGRAVDDFLNNAKPTMPASSVGTVSPNDLADARRLYATSKHAGKIEGIAEAAADATDPAKSTASAFKSYRDKFTKNPEKFNPNTPDQRRLIDEIVTTGKGGTGADTVGKWSNYLLGTGGLATAGGAGAALGMGDKDIHGVSSGAGGAGAAMLGLGLLGKGTSSAMRQQLARTTASSVDDLLRNIVTGQTAQAPGVYVPRNALAILMAKQDLARGAGKAVTSNIDTEKSHEENHRRRAAISRQGIREGPEAPSHSRSYRRRLHQDQENAEGRAAQKSQFGLPKSPGVRLRIHVTPDDGM